MTTPFETVTAAFGDVDAVADICGVTKGQALRWAYPKNRGGADGNVPHRHHPALLRAAVERGVKLSPLDLMPWLAGRAA